MTGMSSVPICSSELASDVVPGVISTVLAVSTSLSSFTMMSAGGSAPSKERSGNGQLSLTISPWGDDGFASDSVESVSCILGVAL